MQGYKSGFEAYARALYSSKYPSNPNMWHKEHGEFRRTIRKCDRPEDFRAMRSLLREVPQVELQKEIEQTRVLSQSLFGKFIRGIEVPAYNLVRTSRFTMLKNLPQHDEHWNDSSVEWLGKASVSKLHRFVVPNDLDDWTNMNALTLGVDGRQKEKITMLMDMRDFAIELLGEQVKNLGFFFHVSPFCSVNLLHMHVVDMDNLGPSYDAIKFRNLSLEHVLQVLQEELDFPVDNQ